MVSVIMPAYNAQQFIERSIKSVLSQTYTHWELIITDDGSFDETKNIVMKFVEDDKRIKYYYQSNGKQGKARNTAIQHANGAYIAFLDADDIWMNTKLERQIVLIENTQADVVFSDAVIINENEEEISDTWGVKEETLKGDKALSSFFTINKVPILTALIRKDAFKKIKGFNEDPGWSCIEDYDLWLRLIRTGATFISKADKLAAYRVYGDTLSQRKDSVKKIVKMLVEFKVEGCYMTKEKEKAIKNWIKKFIINYPITNKAEISEIINYYPGKTGRFFLKLIFSKTTATFSRKVLLFSTYKSSNT